MDQQIHKAWNGASAKDSRIICQQLRMIQESFISIFSIVTNDQALLEGSFGEKSLALFQRRRRLCILTNGWLLRHPQTIPKYNNCMYVVILLLLNKITLSNFDMRSLLCQLILLSLYFLGYSLLSSSLQTLLMYASDGEESHENMNRDSWHAPHLVVNSALETSHHVLKCVQKPKNDCWCITSVRIRS